MHVDKAFGACPLVQIVDVLRDQQKISRPAPFQLGKRQMRWIWNDGAYCSAARVIKVMNQRRVTCKGLGCGDVFDPMSLPQPIGGPEGRDPAVRRHTRARQDYQGWTVLLWCSNHISISLLTLLSAATAATIRDSMYSHAIGIEPADIDHMGHVNNSVYLRWVQEAVVRYWEIGRAHV